jgi:hypothetical protein
MHDDGSPYYTVLSAHPLVIFAEFPARLQAGSPSVLAGVKTEPGRDLALQGCELCHERLPFIRAAAEPVPLHVLEDVQHASRWAFRVL